MYFTYINSVKQMIWLNIIYAKYCKEACRDPDNLNLLGSSLVERLTPDQDDMS